MSEPLITADLVLLDADLGATKTEVIRNLAALVGKTGRADTAGLASDALAREEKAVTGLGGGIAIPHCRSAAVNTNTLAFARLSPKVDFGAADGPADICFMIAASEGSDDAHLTPVSYTHLANQFARMLGVGMAAGSKRRQADDRVVIDAIVGKVGGKDVIILDDEIATAGSVVELIETCLLYTSRCV